MRPSETLPLRLWRHSGMGCQVELTDLLEVHKGTGNSIEIPVRGTPRSSWKPQPRLSPNSGPRENPFSRLPRSCRGGRAPFVEPHAETRPTPARASLKDHACAEHAETVQCNQSPNAPSPIPAAFPCSHMSARNQPNAQPARHFPHNACLPHAHLNRSGQSPAPVASPLVPDPIAQA
jgi:hypothetical protein